MPYVVQSAQGTATASAGTVALPAPTRAGNTLIAVASVRNAGTTNAALASVTLGALQDNFGYAADTGSATSPAHDYWWIDPLCAGGGTTVVYSTVGGAGAGALSMTVLEVGGLVPLPAGPGAVDSQSGNTGTAASWTSGTGGVTNWPASIWVGVAAGAGTRSVTGPGYPWVNLPSQTSGGTASITQVSYLLTEGTQSAAVYPGTFAGTMPYTAGVVTFPGLAAAPALPNLVAGSGPQQGDMAGLWTSPAGFFQQRTIFRAAQVTTTTQILPTTDAYTIGFDTIYEDPWQGWQPASSAWSAPFTGLYQVTLTAEVGTAPANSILILYPGIQGVTTTMGAAVPLPATGGGGQASAYVYAAAGQLLAGEVALFNSLGTITTSGSIPSSLEITWIAGQ